MGLPRDQGSSPLLEWVPAQFPAWEGEGRPAWPAPLHPRTPLSTPAWAQDGDHPGQCLRGPLETLPMASLLPDPDQACGHRQSCWADGVQPRSWGQDSRSRGGGAACGLFIGGWRRGHLGTVLGNLLCGSGRPATSDAFAGPGIAESQVRGGTQNGRRGRSSDDPWWAPSGGPEGLGPRCQAQATPSRCPGCLGVRWGKGLQGTQGGRAAGLGSTVATETECGLRTRPPGARPASSSRSPGPPGRARPCWGSGPASWAPPA